MLRCELHQHESVFDLLRTEWDSLEAETEPRRPYASELWNRMWWLHFHRRTAVVRDELSLFTIRDQEGRLVAVAPMMLTHRPGRGWPQLRKLQFLGRPTSMSEIRGLVTRPHHQTLAIETLRRHLNRTGGWDILRWDGLRAGTADVETATRDLRVRSHGSFEDYILAMPPRWEDLYAQFSKNRRRKTRKVYDTLQQCGIAFRFSAMSDPAGVALAFRDFLALYQARIDAADGELTPRSNRLGGETGVRFLHAFCLAKAERNEMYVFKVEIGGATVAAQLAYRQGRDIYLSYSAFDPRWADRSVMTLLTIEVFKWAIHQRVAHVNLSTGRDLAKLRWQPDSIGFDALTVTRADLGGRLTAALYDSARHVHRLVRRTRPSPQPVADNCD